MLNQTETEETSQAVPRQPLIADVAPATYTAEPASVDLKNLARKLASRRPSERAEAQQMLDLMPIPMILSLMAYQRQQRKSRYVKVGMALLAYSILLLLMAVFAHRSIPIHIWFFMSFGASGAAFTKVQKSGALALAQRADLAVVGELICALELRDKEVQDVIRPALIRLLPQLRFSDVPLLNKESMRVLRQFMEGTLHGREFKRGRSTEDAPLLLAILKALEQVGDASFLPIVNRWANGEQKGENAEVREAAKACLPFLEAISARRKAGSELLRASRAETDPNVQTLLRPAAGTNSIQSDQLLRSAYSNSPTEVESSENS